MGPNGRMESDGRAEVALVNSCTDLNDQAGLPRPFGQGHLRGRPTVSGRPFSFLAILRSDAAPSPVAT